MWIASDVLEPLRSSLQDETVQNTIIKWGELTELDLVSMF